MLTDANITYTATTLEGQKVSRGLDIGLKQTTELKIGLPVLPGIGENYIGISFLTKLPVARLSFKDNTGDLQSLAAKELDVTTKMKVSA